MKERVVAITVTFNRAHTLQRTIECMLNQTYEVYKILIVDNNSNVDNKIIIKTIEKINERVEVIWLEDNLGGAGGFEIGMKYAYHNYKPTWYWIMDDDAYPRKSTLENLLVYKENENVGCLVPLIYGIDKSEYQLYHHKINGFLKTCDKAKYNSIEEIPAVSSLDANAFVGPLFPAKVIEHEGYPMGELFIYGDDTEYTMRIGEKYNIYLIKNAVIDHNDILQENNIVQYSMWWKYYYMLRNRVFIAKKYNRGSIHIGVAIFILFYKLIRQIFNVWKCKKYKGEVIKRIKILCLGFWDGINGKLGKTLEPEKFMNDLKNN